MSAISLCNTVNSSRRMEQTTKHREALSNLLEATRLPVSEVGERLQQALDPSYWEKLNPSASINAESPGSDVEAIAIDAQEAEIADRFFREGYFQLEPALSDTAIAQLKQSLEVVNRAGWPPVFAFVYDQLWLATRTPSLMRLLTAILGPGYGQSGGLWSHIVNPRKGATGWPPHADNHDSPGRVTVWIALNDATLDNGCMYLIPKDRIPRRIVETLYGPQRSVRITDLKLMLQSARALPVRRGTVIGWQHDVIHWGSCHGGEEKEPRISISQEFIGASVKPKEDELVLDAQFTLPTFAQRLYAIASEILAYQSVEALLIRYVDLAQHLIAATGGVAMPNREA